jgi:hypothetical protein
MKYGSSAILVYCLSYAWQGKIMTRPEAAQQSTQGPSSSIWFKASADNAGNILAS